MKHLSTLFALASLMLTPPVVLGEESAAKPVIEQIPADAFVGIYFDDMGELAQEMQEAIALVDTSAAVLLSNMKEVFNGPTLLSISGAPMNPMSWRYDLLIQPDVKDNGAEHKHLFAQLDDLILTPSSDMLSDCSTFPIAVVDDTHAGTTLEMRSIVLPGPMPITLYGVHHGKLFFATSDRKGARRFQETGELPKRIGPSNGIVSLLENPNATPQIALYGYIGSLAPLIQMKIDSELGAGWTDRLGLNRGESVLLTADWKDGNSKVRLTLKHQEGECGLKELFAPAMRPSYITELVPEVYPLVMRGAFDSGDLFIDRAFELLTEIDPVFVREYQEDRAAFRRDYGFDWQDDIFANCTDEFLVATKIAEDGPQDGFLAIHLADPAAFEAVVSNVGGQTGIDWRMSIYDGASIRTFASSEEIQLAFAVMNDYLLITDEERILREIIDSIAERQESETAGKFKNWQKNLPELTAGSMFLDLGFILSEIPEHEMKTAPPFARELFKKIIQQKMGLVGYSEVYPDRVNISFEITGENPVALPTFLIGSVYSSIQASREQAHRMISMANMKGAIIACHIYANEHKNQWPADFKTLVDTAAVIPSMFKSPYDTNYSELTADTVDSHGYYLYRNGTGLSPDAVVICERVLRNGEGAFGFADGHVEWIQGERAQDLYRTMKIASKP